MSVNLSKGQKVNLSKEAAGLKEVMIGLGWDPQRKIFSPDIDCDASAIYCKNGKYAGVVYYVDRTAYSGAIYHHGDNLTGAGKGDDEQITVNLKDLPSDVDRIIFVVNIYAASTRKQDFGMVKNAFIHLMDASNNTEICRYNLSENYEGKTAMVFGEMYKKDNEWKFAAVGEGTTDNSISELCRRYK